MGEKQFYPELESLRGIAAITVAMAHVLQAKLTVNGTATNLGHESWRILKVIGSGHGGVLFFFVLSGFVLAHQLDRSTEAWHRKSGTFLIGRLFRIYPAVWTTLALCVVIYFTTGYGTNNLAASYAPARLAENFFLLHANINGVMWTLQTELLAGPLILALYFATRRWGTIVLYLAFAVFAALSFLGDWNRLVAPDGLPVLQPMHAFVAGMLAWRVSFLYRGCSPWWIAVVTVAFLASKPVIGGTWTIMVESLLASIMIAILVANPAFGGKIGLHHPLLRFYGRISYSFYLLHPLSLVAIWSAEPMLTAAVANGIPPTVLAIGVFVASVIAITPLAYLQYARVERRGVALGRTALELVPAR